MNAGKGMKVASLIAGLYGAMLSPCAAVFDHVGNPTGDWQERDGTLIVLTCFQKLAVTAGRCRHEDEIRVLVINNSIEKRAAQIECNRVDGDVARVIAYLSVDLSPLEHAEYSFRSNQIQTARFGGCSFWNRNIQTTTGWRRLK